MVVEASSKSLFDYTFSWAMKFPNFDAIKSFLYNCTTLWSVYVFSAVQFLLSEWALLMLVFLYMAGEHEYYIFRKGTYKVGRKGNISYGS